MEVKILFWTMICELLLDLVNLGLRLFVAKGIRESEERGFLLRCAEHVLEPKNELIFIVHEIIHFCEDATPFLLSIRQNSENRFQTLTIEFRLYVQIFESEGQLLSLRHTMD